MLSLDWPVAKRFLIFFGDAPNCVTEWNVSLLSRSLFSVFFLPRRRPYRVAIIYFCNLMSLPFAPVRLYIFCFNLSFALWTKQYLTEHWSWRQFESCCISRHKKYYCFTQSDILEFSFQSIFDSSIQGSYPHSPLQHPCAGTAEIVVASSVRILRSINNQFPHQFRIGW